MENLKGVRVLVVGGNGFIGSHLIRRLLKENAEVFAFIRENKKNIEDIYKKIRIYNVDLKNFDDVNKAIIKINPKKIFNVAALKNVDRSLDIIDKIIETNINGNLNIIKALNKDCDCIINIGTIEEYGINNAPFYEDKSIPNPVSPYSASKSSLAMFSMMLYNSFNVPIVFLRPSKVYGPYDSVNLKLNQSLISKLIVCGLLKKEFILLGGDQHRDLLYIDDLIEGIILASTKKEAIGQIINLGSGEGYIIKDIVKKVSNLMKEIKIINKLYRKGENMKFYNDIKKAKKLLNWEPKISIDEGLKRTVEWYKYKHKIGELEKWIVQD